MMEPTFIDFANFVHNMPIEQVIGLFIIWIILGAAAGIVRNGVNYLGGTLVSSSKAISTKTANYRLQIYSIIPGQNHHLKDVVDNLLDDITLAILAAQNTLKQWADNFLEQIVGTHQQFRGQKILGALIELIALAAFIYADAAQGANNLSVLLGVQDASIPEWLKNITIPLIVSSAGTVFMVGMFTGDILGATHLSYWEDLSEKTRKIYLWILIIVLAVAIILNTAIALSRVSVLDSTATWVTVAGNWAQSLLIIPLLIATYLLFRGVFGFFVIFGFVLNVLCIALAVVKYSVKIIKNLSPMVGGSEMVAKFLLFFAFTVLQGFFSLLGGLFKGIMYGVISLIALIFFIPYLLINKPIQIRTGKPIEGHLLSFLQPVVFDPYDEHPLPTV